jgi:predicted RNase H-like nuclease
MSSNLTFIGIDGCKDGWFCVSLDESEDWSYRVVSSSQSLGEHIRHANCVLIDIPIGLLDSGADERQCDTRARQLLTWPRSSSVFPSPARQSLLANDYQQALTINRDSTGRGLSKQTWAIVPKIREIDNMLATYLDLQSVVRECHPELCFWALNGQSAMQYNKKVKAGKQERLAILQQYFKPCQQLFEQASAEFLRRQVAHDDIIDAMVCAVTAKLGYNDYRTIPPLPVKDTHGLPMEMVFCLP